MRALEASDLHLAVGAPPHVRVEGALVPLEGASVLTAADVESQIRPLLTAAHAEELARFGDTELAHGLPDGARFRVRCYLDRTGLGAVLRFVPGAPPSPEALGLPRRVVDLCQLTRGLVLVTGPRGSGASTTLASLVDVCNASRAGRIATIEERFEFVLESRRSLVTQREIGVHAPSFERALRAALREDTDVLMVGELRGAEATMLAVEAADTGRLVFASVPAGGAVEAIERLLSAFPLERQAAVRERLAGTLRAVLSQRLCRLKSTGRVAVFEVLLGTPSVANLLREGQLLPLRSLMHAGRSLGMQVLNDALIELVRAGSVEPAEAYLASNEKGAFRDLLAKLGHRLDPALVARDP
jgi:twitching motility protein PilT